MRRFASGVTSESHQLYGPFMRQLSACIFEWDAGDVCRLLEAKRSELEGEHGMVGLTEAEVSRQIGRKEMALHCRRRTRGSAATKVLLLDLLETFNSERSGVDTLGIPLLDSIRIQAIWKEQRRHLHCIQDPPGVRLAVHRDRQNHQGRRDVAGLSLRTGLHILGVIPPQPVHPR